MKLIKPSYEILEQSTGLEGIYRQIELAARTCYKSESQITEDSAKKFVDMLIARGHTAMLEHGAVYLQVPTRGDNIRSKYYHNPYSRVEYHPTGYDTGVMNITTNYRVLIENDWLDDLKYLCEPTEYHEKRVSVKFNTDIGVTRELNRHRVNSPAEQSTRYCNYSKDKFNNEIAISLNEDIKEYDIDYIYDKWNQVGDTSDTEIFENMCYDIGINRNANFTILDTWLFANLAAQWSYMRLIELGWKPEQARRVLPLGLHTEIVHTAFVSDWKHCFDLRVDGVTGTPHIDMKALMEPVKKEFIKRQWLE